MPEKNILISIGKPAQRPDFANAVELLIKMGYKIFATKGTQEWLEQEGVSNIQQVFKPLVRREPNALSSIQRGHIDMLINVPDSMDSQGVTDGFYMRRASVDKDIPVLTEVHTAILFVNALFFKFEREKEGKEFWGIESWQGYHEL